MNISMIITLLQLLGLSAVFNMIPVISPPTSLLLSYFYIQSHLNVFLLTGVTIFGALIGRTVLYSATRYLGMKFLADNVQSGYELLRAIVHKNDFITILCMSIYCISPLSTAAVFLVAGAARIKIWPLWIGFIVGRSIQYISIALAVTKVYVSFGDLFGENLLNPVSLGFSVLGIIGAGIIIFINWEELILHHKIAFHKKVLKKNKK